MFVRQMILAERCHHTSSDQVHLDDQCTESACFGLGFGQGKELFHEVNRSEARAGRLQTHTQRCKAANNTAAHSNRAIRLQEHASHLRGSYTLQCVWTCMVAPIHDVPIHSMVHSMRSQLVCWCCNSTMQGAATRIWASNRWLERLQASQFEKIATNLQPALLFAAVSRTPPRGAS